MSNLEIQVSDTGVGIEEFNIPYIFDEFFRVNQGGTGRKSGFGLGLAIVKKIILAHSGSIEVTSTLGEGTTFTVLLLKAKEI